MDHRQRRRAVEAVAGLGGSHIVTVSAPVPLRRRECARAAGLQALVRALHAEGIEELVAEARTPVLDRRDVTTVIGARYLLPKGSRFHVQHRLGAEVPLLWAADIVAGAVRAARLGDHGHCRSLGTCVQVLDVPSGL